MAQNSDVCRVCLSIDVRLIPIADSLQDVYEKLTGTPLHTSDLRPVTACYICHAQLKKCRKLMLTSARAENVLTSLLKSHAKVTKTLVALLDRDCITPIGGLTMSKISYTDITPTGKDITNVVIKIEPELSMDCIKTEFNDEEFEAPPKSPEIITPDIGYDNNHGDVETTNDCIQSMSHSGEHHSDTVVKVEFKQEVLEDEENAPNTSSIQESQNTSLKPEPGLFGCPYCQRRFQDSSVFVAHIKMHKDGAPEEVIDSTPIEPQYLTPQPEDGLINCKYCERKFKFASDFERHIRMHTGERPYSCNQCDLRFKLRSHLKRHSKTHTDEKPHQCNVCQRNFNELSSLKRHFRYHTGEKPYECNVCHRKFSELSSMKRHMKTHACEKPEKPFKCDICQRRFIDAEGLKRHATIHSGRPFKCSDCDRVFNTNYSFQVHLRTHTGEKPYECSECHRRFITSDVLATHLRTHTGEKPFQCDFCHVRFTHKSSYSYHLALHTGEKRFECDACQQRFTDKSQLKRHLKKHERGILK